MLNGCRALLALLVFGWSDLTAQGEPAPFQYRSSQINCARFLETAESHIQTQTGGRTQEQTAGRRGVWQFRAQPAVVGVALEGWLDSLALWRRSKESTIRPDTDGLLGGRYRGTLSGTGTYASDARPFVPDEVAEVAAMATALEDFFPPLPGRPIRPGEAWRDSSTVTLRRMADSGLSGVPLYRFELEVRREARSSPVAGDTTRIRLRQISEEHGTFVWHPSLGLLRRDRRILVTTDVPANRRVRQPVHSKLEQRISIVRDLTVPPEIEGRCPNQAASAVR